MKKQSSSLLGFIVVFFIGIACCKCGTNNDQRTTETSPRNLLSADATTNTPAPTSAIAAAISGKTSANLKSLKTAVVISESANLRKTANQSGLSIKEISEGTEVEIVEQTGSWFLVRVNDQEGWLHGNTIRLTDRPKPSNSSQSTTAYSKPSTSYSAQSKTIDNSGASARCRDGSLSYSAHRRGTCSHHGGVAEWY